MKYSEVIDNGLHKILSKKQKYTKNDVNKVLLDSLFNPELNNGKTFTERQARFIVVATAIFHGADYSRNLSNYNKSKAQYFNM